MAYIEWISKTSSIEKIEYEGVDTTSPFLDKAIF